jgi:hypothetical protein
MPTFSDGTDHGRLSIDLSKQNVGTMRLQLQALLDDKEKQLQLAGTLGQRFLAQQNELEERINQLVEAENSIAGKQPGQMDEADSEMRKKLEELQDTLQQWENENQHMWSSLAYGAKVSTIHSCAIISLSLMIDVIARPQYFSSPTAIPSLHHHPGTLYQMPAPSLQKIHRLMHLARKTSPPLNQTGERRMPLTANTTSVRGFESSPIES